MGKGHTLCRFNLLEEERQKSLSTVRRRKMFVPLEWGKQFKMVDADNWMYFKDASGGTIPHHGRRDVLVESPF